MAKKPDTWMPIFVGDYLADTGHLSAAEHGGYFLMLLHYWRTATALPAHDEQLRRIARMTADEWALSKSTLLAFFESVDGLWRHKRVEAELQAARERSDAARTNAGKRWSRERDPPTDAPAMPPHSDGNAPAMPPVCSSSSPSPSQSSSEPPLKETPNGVSPASRNRAAAEQLSPTWKPSDDERGLATALGLSPADLERESRKFVFYYTAGKGTGRRSTPRGWRQTWANWISKAVERLPDFAESQPVTAKREWRWRWPPSLGEANREQISTRLTGWKFSTAKTLAGQCEIDIDGEQLILRAPNKMVRDMLQQQHDDELRRAWGGPIAVSLHSDKRAA